MSHLKLCVALCLMPLVTVAAQELSPQQAAKKVGEGVIVKILVKGNYTPTKAYRSITVLDFTVLLHPEVEEHPQEARVFKQELTAQLAKVVRVIPKDKLARLRDVRIWVEWNRDARRGMTHHPSAKWLKQNGLNPDKADGIEVVNVRNFVIFARNDQPFILLHGFASAYRHRVLSQDNKSIDQAYQQAMEKRLYDNVRHVSGVRKKAYAAASAKTYFSELSESYLGQNDYYPFNRRQLQRYDPVGYRLMSEIWRKPIEE